MQWFDVGAEAGSWVGIMPFGVVFWLLAFTLAAATLVWFRRTHANARLLEADMQRREDAVRLLDERFARGEIDRDDYLKKRRDLFA